MTASYKTVQKNAGINTGKGSYYENGGNINSL